MKFTPEIIETFLRRIAIDGRSARDIGRDNDMPSYEAFYNLMNANEEVRNKYYLAQESRATAIDEEIDRILNRVEKGELEYNQGRLMIDTLKWRMAKFFPRLYGEATQKIEVEHKANFIEELKRVSTIVQKRKEIESKTIDGVVNE